MAKRERSKAPGRQPNAPSAPPFADPHAFPPNPPRRHPWFLLVSALAVAVWLLFLFWMALKAD